MIDDIRTILNDGIRIKIDGMEFGLREMGKGHRVTFELVDSTQAGQTAGFREALEEFGRGVLVDTPSLYAVCRKQISLGGASEGTKVASTRFLVFFTNLILNPPCRT